MRIRKGMTWLAVAGLLVSIGGSGALVLAQKEEKKQEERKLDKKERQELQTLSAAVDSVASGQPAPTAIPLTWVQNHFMKAAGGKEYMPFSVSIDPTALSDPQVALYVRLVSKGAAPAAADGAKTEGAKTEGGSKDPKAEAPAGPAYQNIHLLEVTAPEGGGPAIVSRALAAEAGDYDLYVAIKERNPKKGAQAKVAVIKQPVTIPNFWSDELNTSSVLVATKFEQLTAPVAGDQQYDNPYSLGMLRLVPAVDNKFSKAGDINIFFTIYNPGLDAAKKPDLTIEYTFYQKTGDTEKYFNKTNPMRLNATTLAPDFNYEAGHQLDGSQSVRLASFPEGDYRLEIKITDNITKKTLQRDVRFNVAA
jgi:hypothetical protein